MISTTMDNCETEHQEAHLQELKDRLPGSRNRDQQGGVVLNPLIPDYVEGRDLPVLSRKNRAAVLICIFEGQDGELRVILTRRSMKLSSHPGNRRPFFLLNWENLPYFESFSDAFLEGQVM